MGDKQSMPQRTATNVPSAPTRIIQPDTWSCFACCAAMAVGETLQDVVDFIGHDGSHEIPESTHPEKRAGFAYSEIIRYLVDRGHSIGVYVRFEDGKKFNDLEFARHNGYSCINVPVTFSPGFFVVKSERIPGECHIVYWDGAFCHDPSPASAPERDLEDYLLYEFWPLCDIRDEVWKREKKDNRELQEEAQKAVDYGWEWRGRAERAEALNAKFSAVVEALLEALPPIERHAEFSRERSRGPASHQEFIREDNEDFAAYHNAKHGVQKALDAMEEG